MGRATMRQHREYRVVIGENTYVAVVSARDRVLRGEGPLRRFVGHSVSELVGACRRRGYPVSRHEPGEAR